MADCEADEPLADPNPNPFADFILNSNMPPRSYRPYVECVTVCAPRRCIEQLANEEVRKIAWEEYKFVHNTHTKIPSFDALQMAKPAIARHYLERAYDLYTQQQQSNPNPSSSTNSKKSIPSLKKKTSIASNLFSCLGKGKEKRRQEALGTFRIRNKIRSSEDDFDAAALAARWYSKGNAIARQEWADATAEKKDWRAYLIKEQNKMAELRKKAIKEAREREERLDTEIEGGGIGIRSQSPFRPHPEFKLVINSDVSHGNDVAERGIVGAGIIGGGIVGGGIGGGGLLRHEKVEKADSGKVLDWDEGRIRGDGEWIKEFVMYGMEAVNAGRVRNIQEFDIRDPPRSPPISTVQKQVLLKEKSGGSALEKGLQQLKEEKEMEGMERMVIGRAECMVLEG